jgi:outer membrane receptor protein involved in Fe transport
LPYGLQLGGVFQNLPGTPILANAVFTNAQVATSLGRNLAACGASTTCNATVTIPLIPNLTKFESRVNQLDLRIGRQFTLGRMTATPALDVYNVFSADPVVGRNNTYGSAWGTPTRFLDGRLAKLGIQVTF